MMLCWVPKVAWRDSPFVRRTRTPEFAGPPGLIWIFWVEEDSFLALSLMYAMEVVPIEGLV
jgi:hypothetical protein